jgi:hypothetical protein
MSQYSRNHSYFTFHKYWVQIWKVPILTWLLWRYGIPECDTAYIGRKVSPFQRSLLFLYCLQHSLAIFLFVSHLKTISRIHSYRFFHSSERTCPQNTGNSLPNYVHCITSQKTMTSMFSARTISYLTNLTRLLLNLVQAACINKINAISAYQIQYVNAVIVNIIFKV